MRKGRVSELMDYYFSILFLKESSSGRGRLEIGVRLVMFHGRYPRRVIAVKSRSQYPLLIRIWLTHSTDHHAPLGIIPFSDPRLLEPMNRFLMGYPSTPVSP